jgi:hypothetical protein
VHYPQSGERRAVNVLRIEAPAANNDATGSGGCHLNLINWEQVGGLDWRTPHVSGGSVLIGDVPAGQFVESANPALTDTQTLSWDLSGPASISYTLFDTSDQAHHEIYVFLGGVLAALAATLLVEVVKAAPEAFSSVESPEPPSFAGREPVATRPGSAGGETAHGPMSPARASQDIPVASVRAGASPTGNTAIAWLGIGVVGGWVLGRLGRRPK